MLKIQLLGGFEFTDNGQALTKTFPPRAQALLADLLLRAGSTCERDELARRHWGESNEGQARTNLRRELHQLRMLSPGLSKVLISDRKTVSLVLGSGDCVDVLQFLESVDACSTNDNTALPESATMTTQSSYLQRALALYRGPLLPKLRDAWLEDIRDSLSRKLVAAASQFSANLSRHGRNDQAISIALRLVDLVPANETAYEQLMRLQIQEARWESALQTYELCQSRLMHELGVAPASALQAMHKQAMAAREVAAHSKERARAVVGSTHDGVPYVKRGDELSYVEDLISQVGIGPPRLCLIEGETGIGKSCLAETVLQNLIPKTWIVARARGWVGAAREPFCTIHDLLRSPSIRLRLPYLDLADAQALGGVFPDVFAHEHAVEPDYRVSRNRLFDVLNRSIAGWGTPTLVFIDDLQWCDADSLDWLTHLLHSELNGPSMVLATVRSEEADQNRSLRTLINRCHAADLVDWISLSRFTKQQCAQLIQLSSEGTGLQQHPNDLVDEIFSRSSGIPLLVVELVRSASNGRADVGTNPVRLPKRVHAVFLQRVDQLAPASRRLIDIAAVFGHEVTISLLAHFGDPSTGQVVEALDEALRLRLLEARGSGLYGFSHDGIREAVYYQMMSASRVHLHRQIASALKDKAETDKEEADTFAAQIAYHYEQSGSVKEAVSWYARAADVAEAVNAGRRTIDALTAALSLLADVAQTPATAARRMRMLIGVANHQSVLDGLCSPVTVHTCERIEALLPAVQEPILRVQAMNRLRVHYMNVSMKQAFEFAKEVAVTSEKIGDPTFVMEAYRSLGLIHMYSGALLESEKCHARGAAAQRHDKNDNRVSDEAESIYSVLLHGTWVRVLLLLGDFERAADIYRESQAIQVSAAQPMDALVACYFQAGNLDDWPALDLPGTLRHCQQASERLTALHDIPLGQPLTAMIAGWHALDQTDPHQAIDHFSRAIEFLDGQHFGLVYQSRCLSGLAKAHLAAGNTVSASHVINRGFDVQRQTGETGLLPEFQRLQALAMASNGGTKAAVVTCFEQAIASAKQQHATLYAERASQSLAQFLSRGSEVAQYIMAAGPDGSLHSN